MLSDAIVWTVLMDAVAILILGIAAVSAPRGSNRAAIFGAFAITAGVLLVILIWLYYLVVGS